MSVAFIRATPGPRNEQRFPHLVRGRLHDRSTGMFLSGLIPEGTWPQHQPPIRPRQARLWRPGQAACTKIAGHERVFFAVLTISGTPLVVTCTST